MKRITLTIPVTLVSLLRVPPLFGLSLLCIGRRRWLVLVNADGNEYSLRIR
jgi:hypothetical protein